MATPWGMGEPWTCEFMYGNGGNGIGCMEGPRVGVLGAKVGFGMGKPLGDNVLGGNVLGGTDKVLGVMGREVLSGGSGIGIID